MNELAPTSSGKMGCIGATLHQNGPIGAERPNDIHEAGSVTFLAGNMAMGVINSRLYRSTHSELYLSRAVRGAIAIQANLTDGRGVLLDERDAWANGTFAFEWAGKCYYFRECLRNYWTCCGIQRPPSQHATARPMATLEDAGMDLPTALARSGVWPAAGQSNS